MNEEVTITPIYYSIMEFAVPTIIILLIIAVGFFIINYIFYDGIHSKWSGGHPK
jgi:hypothetical protein